jgi:hypothetical protein
MLVMVDRFAAGVGQQAAPGVEVGPNGREQEMLVVRSAHS